MTIDWAELLLKHVLSMPVAIVVVALLFRRFLLGFLGDVTTAKVGPVELERRLDKVQKDTEALKELNRLLAENEQLKLTLAQKDLEKEPDEEKGELVGRLSQGTLEISRVIAGMQ